MVVIHKTLQDEANEILSNSGDTNQEYPKIVRHEKKTSRHIRCGNANTKKCIGLANKT